MLDELYFFPSHAVATKGNHIVGELLAFVQIERVRCRKGRESGRANLQDNNIGP